ncbi:MAG: OmpA/MotB [Proteobacteria bacterium]|nr:OmpA/MotB [Pseudomonadota bacterium]
MRTNLNKFVVLLLAGVALLAGCSAPPARQAGAVSPPPPVEQGVPPAEAPSLESSKASDEKITAAISDDFNVYFAVGSSTISEVEKEKLRGHAERLKEDKQLHVTLFGHADDTGSRSYNLALTDMRVSAVSKQLRSFGVSARQMRRNVIGRERRASHCKFEACRQKLRRVELVYSRR